MYHDNMSVTDIHWSIAKNSKELNYKLFDNTGNISIKINLQLYVQNQINLYKQIHGCMQNIIDFNIEYFNELMHINIVYFFCEKLWRKDIGTPT